MYNFIERVGIMADSGIDDIRAAFADTEGERVKIEAKHCLDFYNLEERRAYLSAVQEWRGEEGRKRMEAAMLVIWNERKAVQK